MKKYQQVFTSIRAKVVALLLVCIIVSIVVSCFSILPDSKRTYVEATKNNLMDLTETSTLLINKSIEDVNETLENLSCSPELYTYITSGGSTYKAQETIDNYLKENDSFTSVTIYDLKGKAILSSDDAIVGTDGSSLPYVQSVISNGKAVQSDIITDGVKTPSIVCNFPILSSGQDIMGVISTTVPAKDITSILKDTKLRNIKSSYAYIVSENGKIIYHPNAKLVGTDTDNLLIKEVMKVLKNGKMPKSNAIAYKDGGNFQYTGFSVSKENHWILIIVADQNELLASINALSIRSGILSMIELLIMAIIGYLIASTITKPIQTMTKTITKIASLDFTSDIETDKLSKRKDETGEMSRVIQDMRINIRRIIEEINQCSESSNRNADELNEICNDVNIHSNDISTTVEGVLLSMEETSSTADIINNNIIHIDTTTNDINEKSQKSMIITNEIVKRADELESNTKKAVEHIQTVYNNVKIETTTAMEKSQSVSKINTLTDSILDIANQIKLLSLNASIEAARAGDYGRGFAVVAQEIGALSVKSTQTVTEIAGVTNEVTEAMKHIDTCLKEIISLIENTVLPDYQGYIAISTQYSNDADVFHETVQNIQTEIESLGKVTELIVNSISEINSVINHSTSDISKISKKTVDIVSLTENTYNRVKDSKVYANDLKDIIVQFNL